MVCKGRRFCPPGIWLRLQTFVVVGIRVGCSRHLVISDPRTLLDLPYWAGQPHDKELVRPKCQQCPRWEVLLQTLGCPKLCLHTHVGRATWQDDREFTQQEDAEGAEIGIWHKERQQDLSVHSLSSGNPQIPLSEGGWALTIFSVSRLHATSPEGLNTHCLFLPLQKTLLSLFVSELHFILEKYEGLEELSRFVITWLVRIWSRSSWAIPDSPRGTCGHTRGSAAFWVSELTGWWWVSKPLSCLAGDRQSFC